MKNFNENLNTRIVHSGWNSAQNGGVSGTPVSRASTVYFESSQTFEKAQKNKLNELFYGRFGTATNFSFEEAMAELEGGDDALAVCSGTAAITASVLSFVRTGENILLPDNVWGPIRHLCDGVLSTLGISTTYYDPATPELLSEKIQDNTRVLYLESPGSVTYEVQDIPAFVEVAKRYNLITMIDNTWASPVFFNPLRLGVDVSIVAATKFVNGHSDVIIGVIVSGEKCAATIRQVTAALGFHASPDDCYLAHRGLKTAAIRMKQHEKNGMALAHWLQDRPEVSRVLHPALPSHPGHDIWKRDFTGSSGVFGVELENMSQDAVHAMLSGLTVFGIGASWGGLQSVIIQAHAEKIRTVNSWGSNPLLRIHTGLEDVDDLTKDLEQAFERASKYK